MLTVIGYALMVVASLPPVIAILRLLLSSPQREAPEPQPAELTAQG
jgi:hypothetical protein